MTATGASGFAGVAVGTGVSVATGAATTPLSLQPARASAVRASETDIARRIEAFMGPRKSKIPATLRADDFAEESALFRRGVVGDRCPTIPLLPRSLISATRAALAPRGSYFVFFFGSS